MHGDWSKQADEGHDLIFQMIAEKNEEGAEQAMRAHILSSLSTALKRIEGVEDNEQT
ncbi:hypothetical protein D3C80_2195410 [compost metagenome]